MHVAFYKFRGRKGLTGFGDWLIRLVTTQILFSRRWPFSRLWGPYSHAELVFSDGTWFSSSIQDRGVRFKSIAIDLERWDFFQIEATPEEEERCRAWANGREFRMVDGVLQRRGYDFAGIFLSQLLPLGIEDKGRDYCNEVVHLCLQAGTGRFEGKPTNYNPNTFYLLITGGSNEF